MFRALKPELVHVPVPAHPLFWHARGQEGHLANPSIGRFWARATFILFPPDHLLGHVGNQTSMLGRLLEMGSNRDLSSFSSLGKGGKFCIYTRKYSAPSKLQLLATFS